MKIQVKTIFLILGIVFCLILLTNQLFSELPQDKTELDKLAQRSTTISQPQEEDSLLSDISGFLKILLIVVVALCVGYYFYWIYRRIREIEEYIVNNLNKPIREEKISQHGTPYVQSFDYSKKYPIGGTREESYPPQEISRINQKIEAIERRFNIYSDEHKKILEESRRQNRLYSLLQELFRKETSARESILQEISKIQKGSILSYEEPEIRKEEPQKPTFQTKKPLTEQHLIEWWNKFGSQLFSECKETLNDTFLNVESNAIVTRDSDEEDWKLITVEDKNHNYFYVLPRKNSDWTSTYQKWFVLEEEGRVMGPVIRSVILPLPKAIKYISGEWGLKGAKGKVSIKESQ